MAGRIAKIDMVENGVELFAEAWAIGGKAASRQALADEWGVSKDTITNWTQRDDVKAAAGKFIRDQVLRSKRKIDAKIAEAIEQLDPVEDFELLLKARKELAPDVPKDADKTSDELLLEAFEVLDTNPELAQKLQERAADAAGS